MARYISYHTTCNSFFEFVYRASFLDYPQYTVDPYEFVLYIWMLLWYLLYFATFPAFDELKFGLRPLIARYPKNLRKRHYLFLQSSSSLFYHIWLQNACKSPFWKSITTTGTRRTTITPTTPTILGPAFAGKKPGDQIKETYCTSINIYLHFS